MNRITILTGAPGTGKTTVARLLADRAERGLHIPSDIFYSFPAHPISPNRPEAQEQNEAVIAALVGAALTFSRHGYLVVLDSIFGPWFLPFIARQLLPGSPEIDYVILRADLPVALERIRNRAGHLKEDVVRQMHGEFDAHRGVFGRFEVESSVLDSPTLAAEIERLRAEGRFLLDLRSI